MNEEERQNAERFADDAERETVKLLHRVLKPVAPPAKLEGRLRERLLVEWEKVPPSEVKRSPLSPFEKAFSWFLHGSRLAQAGIAVATVALICGAIFGILNLPGGTPTPIPPINVVPGQPIEVKVGQNFIISLDENPSNGYTWQEEFDARFLELVENKYEPSSETGVVGAGGKRSFKFKALKEGETEVTMTLKRACEEEPLEEKVFTVSIS